jgi:hypothetical protein
LPTPLAFTRQGQYIRSVTSSGLPVKGA